MSHARNFKTFMRRCAGKMQHKTYISAQYYRENLSSSPEADIYECNFCSHFHIGTSKSTALQPNLKKIIRKQDKNNEQRIRKFKYNRD